MLCLNGGCRGQPRNFPSVGRSAEQKHTATTTVRGIRRKVFRTVQNIRRGCVWNRSVQTCGTEVCRSVPQEHFISLRYSSSAPRRGAQAAGRPTHAATMARRRPASRPGDGIKSAKEQTCAWPPASESLHTYSCTRSTHVAAHGRAHGTTKKRLHEPHKRVAAHVTCTCNYQCLELRNSSEHVQNTSIWLVGTR